MKLITPHSSRKSWIAIADDADESGLVKRIKQADIILSDLDQTDAFPAKELVLNFVMDGRNLFNRHLWHWFGTVGYLLYVEGKRAFNDATLSFTNSFIKTPRELTRIKKKYQQSYVTTTFYPGVLDFYKALPQALKIYVTRNIEEIAKPYAEAANFNYALQEQYDKKNAVDIVRKQFPERKRFIIRGDSSSEEIMATRCRELLIEEDLTKRIDDTLYINVAGSYRAQNPRADINVSINQTALAEWVRDFTI
ncbi:hypothetical protein HY485_05265 [Candidatus Woesearchaeota archaeon]|nr:hypothetical protein [Candidatus Woesearchaeota archaeon]